MVSQHKQDEKAQKTILVTEELHNKMRDFAGENGMKVSGLAEVAIKKFIMQQQTMNKQEQTTGKQQ